MSFSMDTSLFRVSQEGAFSLADASTDAPADFDKEAAKKVVKKHTKRIRTLQEQMWAEQKQRFLVVLQAIDTGGKDGTIRAVFGRTNPQGFKVQPFKRPTEHELSHDYLWRVHPHVPADGEIVVFNRSHYEDILVVKVHGYAPDELIEKRYQHIRNFEQMLSDEGTTIIKIFLHITKDEQKRRLEDRLNQPEKNWKFEMSDLKERAYWEQYQEAFEKMIQRTSTESAPWYVIPANNKKYRNQVISSIIVETMENFNMEWPKPAEGLEDIIIE
ncbi:MAG: deoxynucleoside kinase [Candidatus Poseidoniaceae archaeon]